MARPDTRNAYALQGAEREGQLWLASRSGAWKQALGREQTIILEVPGQPDRVDRRSRSPDSVFQSAVGRADPCGMGLCVAALHQVTCNALLFETSSLPPTDTGTDPGPTANERSARASSQARAKRGEWPRLQCVRKWLKPAAGQCGSAALTCERKGKLARPSERTEPMHHRRRRSPQRQSLAQRPTEARVPGRNCAEGRARRHTARAHLPQQKRGLACHGPRPTRAKTARRWRLCAYGAVLAPPAAAPRPTPRPPPTPPQPRGPPSWASVSASSAPCRLRPQVRGAGRWASSLGATCFSLFNNAPRGARACTRTRTRRGARMRNGRRRECLRADGPPAPQRGRPVRPMHQ